MTEENGHIDGLEKNLLPKEDTMQVENPTTSNNNTTQQTKSTSDDHDLPISKNSIKEEIPVDMKMEEEQNGMTLPIIVGNQVTVLNLGSIDYERKAFRNNRYIFPIGFKSSRPFHSYMTPGTKVLYFSEVLDDPTTNAPLFQVTASDDPEQHYISNTPTGAWTQILKKTQSAGRRSSTAVSGPEMFGFSTTKCKTLILGLPHADKCLDPENENFMKVEVEDVLMPDVSPPEPGYFSNSALLPSTTESTTNVGKLRSSSLGGRSTAKMIEMGSPNIQQQQQQQQQQVHNSDEDDNNNDDEEEDGEEETRTGSRKRKSRKGRKSDLAEKHEPTEEETRKAEETALSQIPLDISLLEKLGPYTAIQPHSLPVLQKSQCRYMFKGFEVYDGNEPFDKLYQSLRDKYIDKHHLAVDPTQKHGDPDIFASKERQLLRSMWEFIFVCHSCAIMRPILRLPEFSCVELEDALLNPVENNALLCDIHMKVLRGPQLDKKSQDIIAAGTSTQWLMLISNKLDSLSSIYWDANPLRRMSYEELKPFVRVLILKDLCEMKMFTQDRILDSIRQLGDALRIEAFGTDKEGNKYYYFGEEVGRLIKEIAPSATSPGRFSTVCDTLEEFKEFLAQISKSHDKNDKALAKALEFQLPYLENYRAEKDERKRVMMEAIQKEKLKQEEIRRQREEKRRERERAYEEKLKKEEEAKHQRLLQKETDLFVRRTAQQQTSAGFQQSNGGLEVVGAVATASITTTRTRSGRSVKKSYNEEFEREDEFSDEEEEETQEGENDDDGQQRQNGADQLGSTSASTSNTNPNKKVNTKASQKPVRNKRKKPDDDEFVMEDADEDEEFSGGEEYEEEYNEPEDEEDDDDYDNTQRSNKDTGHAKKLKDLREKKARKEAEARERQRQWQLMQQIKQRPAVGTVLMTPQQQQNQMKFQQLPMRPVVSTTSRPVMMAANNFSKPQASIPPKLPPVSISLPPTGAGYIKINPYLQGYYQNYLKNFRDQNAQQQQQQQQPTSNGNTIIQTGNTPNTTPTNNAESGNNLSTGSNATTPIHNSNINSSFSHTATIGQATANIPKLKMFLENITGNNMANQLLFQQTSSSSIAKTNSGTQLPQQQKQTTSLNSVGINGNSTTVAGSTNSGSQIQSAGNTRQNVATAVPMMAMMPFENQGVSPQSGETSEIDKVLSTKNFNNE